MASRYHHDYTAFGRVVLRGEFMVEEMLKRAEKVKARAEVTAPYYADDPDLVHYRDHFSTEAGLREDRAFGRIYNTDMPTALFVEFGTKNNPKHATLRNALDAAGD